MLDACHAHHRRAEMSLAAKVYEHPLHVQAANMPFVNSVLDEEHCFTQSSRQAHFAQDWIVALKQCRAQLQFEDAFQ